MYILITYKNYFNCKENSIRTLLTQALLTNKSPVTPTRSNILLLYFFGLFLSANLSPAHLNLFSFPKVVQVRKVLLYSKNFCCIRVFVINSFIIHQVTQTPALEKQKQCTQTVLKTLTLICLCPTKIFLR